MQISLAGKTAIVTGASKGIGKAIAAQFAAAGANVMLNSRKQDQLDAAVAEIRASGAAGEVETFAVNAGDVDGAAACVAATIERFGGLDILVNNAATNPYYGPTLGVDVGQFDKTLGVNVRGPLFWAQQAWAQAFKERPGVIVNIASVGGLRAEHGLGVYNVSKAALVHLTRQLALELGPTRVVGVAPGLVETDFASVLVENFGDALAKRLPTGRIGQPDDIANLVTFLASDAASWITGEIVTIDGGAGVASGH
jgi:NAD(P)-dependent dehydrogenase (short-subunit alcohol dehydrogenase family)